MNLVWVTDAKYVKDYKMILTFNTGEQKLFDGMDVVSNSSIYAPIRQPDTFADFSLDSWTVNWENGTIDIAPEYLYEHSKLII